MPLSLNELLERIRPAGAPGAPSEGEQQREEFDRLHEVAGLAAILQAFEEEADALISTADDVAAERRRDAERQAREIRAGVPDRVAAVEAAAIRAHDERDRAMRDSVEAEAETEIARLQAQADALIPSLRDAVVKTIWSVMPPGSDSEGLP